MPTHTRRRDLCRAPTRCAFFQKLAEVLLESIPTRTSQSDYIANGDTAVFACILESIFTDNSGMADRTIFSLSTFLASRFICCWRARRKNKTQGCQFGVSVLIVSCV